MTYEMTWDIETFFAGGSDSKEFSAYLDQIKQGIEHIQHVPPGAQTFESFCQTIDQFSSLHTSLREAFAFTSCLVAQDMTDEKAKALQGQLVTLNSRATNALTVWESSLTTIGQTTWDEWMRSEELGAIAFPLNEIRETRAQKLSDAEETLINALSMNGYQGWELLYNTLVQSIRVPFEEDGQTTWLSAGQAANALSSPDTEVRERLFASWEKAWADKGAFFAETLNNFGGFRLQVYGARGWDSIMKEPLQHNRMKEETLDAMWGAITKHKQPFVQYLQRKAELLGKAKMDWQDVNAPLGENKKDWNYQAGAEFIRRQFHQFSEAMGDFAEHALSERWIEAEDRDNKRPGGFCTTFPESKESRIFMTYAGTASNVLTLAHELGHAFHNYVLRDLPLYQRSYSMNVAETASTFAEMIVTDAAVNQASSKNEKMALLDDKLQRSVAFFMDIHSRYLFETRFYEERKNGSVPYQRLNELMEEAQQEAFAGAIGKTHPHFWASKLHFYNTSVPFYNFPYTFGYLFSLSVYARAQKEGKNFEEKYMDLLRDTASMTVEDLAMKHLQADITKEAFWEEGIALCIEDVEEFLELTEGESAE
ncbi:M3 family oligoendopeptidase [Aureibacillus halotolerans]|uniref:PepF/M3 family oligoendopeptidase n=1 Tax=Aureibacillus halotolerans TaxID=1508390 RepID=A0A4R6TTW9_9BACI|nr:M3 family oligoendopeptidase [Aureibacillus halotolerans]TDQ37148.1 pepF/M3 family oligoendopeptidase [Aureibacillus halotolerans]